MTARTARRGVFGRNQLAFVALPAFLFLLPGSASAQESPFEVSAEAYLSKDDPNRGVIRATIEVPGGHYLYRNQLRVLLADTLALDLLGVDYPAGKVQYDPFLEEKTEVYESTTTVTARVTGRAGQSFPDSARAFVLFQGCTSEFCYFPEEVAVSVPWGSAGALGGAVVAAGTGPAAGPPLPVGGVRVGGAGGFDVAQKIQAKGLLFTFLAVFFSGILLSFTPCVFPMIPITLAVIGARGQTNPAKGFFLSLLYVVGMALTYALLGLVAASTGALFGSLFQNPIFVLAIVAIFVALAFGMFGLYELQIPSSVAARLQRVGGSGGWIGIFLMGIVAGLVASPCIGPVLVGLLVYIAQTGSGLLGFTLLFTLGMGIGVLFLVIGTFYGLITSLPGAGGWMEDVKKSFGFLLLGVALYFAAPLLNEQVVLLAAGILLLLAASTVLGLFDPLPAGAGTMKRIKKAFALLVGSSGVVLFLATLVVPYLPLPVVSTSTGEPIEKVTWIESYDEGFHYARANKLPMMIDFTAAWCAACKELEHNTYTSPAVVDESKRFAAIKVDCTRSTDTIKSLRDEYDIRGLPTIIWIDSSGNVQEELTVTGFVDAENYLKIMRSVQ